MKYENLTTKEKILNWFDTHKRTINDHCESGKHILDWIYGGYRGKDTAKMDLVYELTKRGMNFNSISQDIFRSITFQFLKSPSQPGDSNLVLINILNDNKLQTLKQDLPNFNNIVSQITLYDSVQEHNALKEQIAYTNLAPFKKQEKPNSQYTIGYDAHPIVFFFQYHIFQNTTELKFLKHIEKFQRYNENLNLNDIIFNYLENNYNCRTNFNKLAIRKIV